MSDIRERIARRVAKFFKDGDLVNLGIGLPTLVADYLPEGLEIDFHGENGVIGLGKAPDEDSIDKDIYNAGVQPATLLPGASCFDSAMSFSIIRGGHVDVTVLGALEVDQEGSLANWIIPGKLVPGMGGAMDLVAGARTVIVATEHCTKTGDSKILKSCILPLTAYRKVNYIVTELCVLEVTSNGLLLLETAPGITPEEVQAKTQATLIVPETVGCME
ncbi:3-oxoacid CoA-transferase subunit B [Flavonifractor sp. HCP28S3_F3]|uniref:3-oxoacid CoA-transferase subunit B n=1 Tax=Flavonifractor sp. HCP28S3_F3 TaxID=3438939 RepID=UPI003F8AE574